MAQIRDGVYTLTVESCCGAIWGDAPVHGRQKMQVNTRLSSMRGAPRGVRQQRLNHRLLKIHRIAAVPW